jgi:hypothetical protein
MAGFEYLYLTMFLLGFGGSAALVWWGRRRARNVYESEDYQSIDPSVLPPGDGAHARAPARPTPIELGATEVDESGSAPIGPMLASTSPGIGDRECPTCSRRFGEAMVICPHDSTPLEPVIPRSRRTARPALTGSRRPVCTSCGRRYQAAARHCYHDGARLTAESPAVVPIIRVCRDCGFETMDEYGSCDCETPDMVEIDPSDSQVVMPTIPMMHCRRCDFRSVGGSTTHCPHDGDLMYPIMNVRMNALPPTGIGPRRKVCTECGRKSSPAAHYCAYDGTKLEHLN